METSYVEFTAAARGIGDRTDAAGAPVADLSAEEDRLANLLTEGAVSPAGAFVVTAAGGMDLEVGSGTAKADLYAVAGETAGQGAYLVRLDQAPIVVTVPAADAAQSRTDEVYLVVADAAYDAGAVSLPRIGYRKGDPGGGAPGPDAGWEASALLATVTVPAAAAAITAGNLVDARVDAHAIGAVPAGTVQMYAGAAAPAGWLLCQGQAVSRSTFARLFRAIGTTFGGGDGATTFNVPDLRERFPVGAKAGGDYDLGDTGGAAQVALTTAQLPSHTHPFTTGSAGAHIHTVSLSSNAGGGEPYAVEGDQATFSGAGNTDSQGAHTHSGNTDATGGAGSHENRPPFVALNMIIKS